MSPLRRTKETLHYSTITYDHLYINENFRERIFSECDCLLFEHRDDETDSEFFSRVSKFHKELEDLCLKHKKILLIGHSYFFNAWYRRGCYTGPSHANITRLV